MISSYCSRLSLNTFYCRMGEERRSADAVAKVGGEEGTNAGVDVGAGLAVGLCMAKRAVSGNEEREDGSEDSPASMLITLRRIFSTL